MGELPALSATINGVALAFDKRLKLVIVTPVVPAPLPGREVHRGEIAIREALPFIYEPDAFFVQRIVDDFGRDFRGDEAIEFAERKGDAYPRASVLGIRASTGQDEQIFLKQLDLARWMTPVAYAGVDTITALGQVHAILRIDADVAGIEVTEEIISGTASYVAPISEVGRLEQHLFR